MFKEIDDTNSLGIEPLEVLGYSTEEELLEALVPLMEEIKTNEIIMA